MNRCKEKVINKSTHVLVKNIISKYIKLNLFLMNKKNGWLNEILFKGIKQDTHTTAIKVGQRMEHICREIAQIKYGIRSVPFYICGEGVTDEDAQQYFEKKYPKTSYEQKNFCHILNGKNTR